MSTSLDILKIRQRLGRKDWSVPQMFGPDGWRLDSMVGYGRIIVSLSEMVKVPGGEGEWIHASISYRDRLPTYEDLTRLHKAVWPTGYAYQVFAPEEQHINIHAFALHLWAARTDPPSSLSLEHLEQYDLEPTTL